MLIYSRPLPLPNGRGRDHPTSGTILVMRLKPPTSLRPTSRYRYGAGFALKADFSVTLDFYSDGLLRRGMQLGIMVETM